MDVFHAIHSSGVDFILKVQSLFAGYEEFMLTMSRAGDPRNAFLIYFPLVYGINAYQGRRVMLAAVASEWLNIVLKWVLFAGRPYWWVHENHHPARMTMKQFPLTCETGPGSPSGHAMVTAAVYFVIANACTAKLPKWIAYSTLMVTLVPIGLARIFIGTHFPHQVAVGTYCGIYISLCLDKFTDTSKWNVVKYLKVSLALFSGCLGFSWILGYFRVDLHWTIPLAYKWCERPKEWVSLNTAPFNSIVCVSSVLASYGVSEKYACTSQDTSTKFKIHHTILAVLSVNLLRYLKFSFSSTLYFYAFSAIKHALIPFLIVYLVPKIVNALTPGKLPEKED